MKKHMATMVVGRMLKAAELTSDAVNNMSNAELVAVISKGKGKMSGFGEKLGRDQEVATMLSYV